MGSQYTRTSWRQTSLHGPWKVGLRQSSSRAATSGAPVVGTETGSETVLGMEPVLGVLSLDNSSAHSHKVNIKKSHACYQSSMIYLYRWVGSTLFHACWNVEIWGAHKSRDSQRFGLFISITFFTISSPTSCRAGIESHIQKGSSVVLQNHFSIIA